MRYRIKILTTKFGKTSYIPQVKAFIGWESADLVESSGKVRCYDTYCDNRDQALKIIDRHYTYSQGKQTIEFEYITK